MYDTCTDKMRYLLSKPKPHFLRFVAIVLQHIDDKFKVYTAKPRRFARVPRL